MTQYNLTALLHKEKDMFVALCPELDIASQGVTVEEAESNLKEAVELFFEHASFTELQDRLHEKTYITQFQVSHS